MILRSLYDQFDEYKNKNIVFKKKKRTSRLFFERISITLLHNSYRYSQIIKWILWLKLSKGCFFFMNPSVIEENKVDKYIHYFLMDSLNILMYYILIFWWLARKKIIFFIAFEIFSNIIIILNCFPI